MKNTGIDGFLEVLGSKEPVPGGGGAAALVGAIGSALGSMVGNLTVGKKKYADVEDDIKELLIKSEALTAELESLIDGDAEAFRPLAKAYGLPSSTDEEKAEKHRVIQEALEGAASAPLEIARVSLEVLRLMDEYALKGSRLAVSDAGCGAAFCGAAIRAAQLNVMINLRLMDNAEKRSGYEKKLDDIVKEGAYLEDKIFTYVKEELAGG